MVRSVLCLLFLLAGCAGGRMSDPVGQEVRLHNHEIASDTVWSGRVVIDGWVKVDKGAILTIQPGTQIVFVPRDDDRDGLGDGTLIVEGSLRAIGNSREPIRFASASSTPKPGDWLEIRVDFSREIALRYCEIRDSAHTLHAHFTKAVLEDSHIHHNIDGCRLGQGSFVLRHNLIERNEGKGINFRNATVEITNNIIRHNGAGIFLFETDRTPVIAQNNLHDNGFNLRLGDFFPHDLTVGANWWGSADPETVQTTIYDRQQDSTLGTVKVSLLPGWVAGTGPRRALALHKAWELETSGYLDASVIRSGASFHLPGWDGKFRAFNAEGELLWSRDVGEAMDATPTYGDGLLFGQHWGREVFALEAASGEWRWRRPFAASPADDHRQGGLLLSEDTLLVPLWNGTLQALASKTGALRWEFVAGMPLRATPVASRGQIFLSGGDGTLWALSHEGGLLWRALLDGPLLSSATLVRSGPVAVTRNGTVHAFDWQGTLLWRRALEQICYYSAPQSHDQELFVATAAGSLWKLDARDGKVIWRRDGFGPIYASPLLWRGLLVVGDNAGRLSVVAADSGDLLTSLVVAGAIQGTPLPFKERLIFGARDGRIHAVDLVETTLP